MGHVCDICGASFKRPSRLIIHQRTHTGERPFKCPCGRSYIRRQHLTRHAATCQGIPSRPLKSKGLLNKSSDSGEYSCPKCDLGHFSRKKSVWAHISIVHGDRRFKCTKCDAAFTTNSKLERHQRRHHDLKCQICEKRLTSAAPPEGINDIIGASTSTFPPDSIERFENFIELRKHIAKHHPKHKFICKICHHRCSRRAHLLEHELSHAPVEERRNLHFETKPRGAHSRDPQQRSSTLSLHATLLSCHSFHKTKVERSPAFAYKRVGGCAGTPAPVSPSA
ncbi:Endothelial zinc finger protein induced by tumor necrosi factor alpha [Taenia crassiceps]|uniref:Endothelial zinc finger protein induced by tumor necrosi factor alpha n=1 Tax=Taenia crassiceps TaxID=6207 RepID=A0ABR4QML2_9CEST